MIRLEVYSNPENCPACRRMEPIYEELSKEFPTIFVDLSTDDGIEIAGRNNIRSMPTLVIYKDSVIENVLMGAMPETKIREAINEIL